MTRWKAATARWPSGGGSTQRTRSSRSRRPIRWNHTSRPSWSRGRFGCGTREAPKRANVAFWAPHADLFDSPRAYALVISALLERRDFIAAMALLVHWLANADRVGLRSGGNSLPRLSERWLLRLRCSAESDRTEFGEPYIEQAVERDTRQVCRWHASCSTTTKPTPSSSGRRPGSRWPNRSRNHATGNGN